jgi:hypothetical protein
MLSFCAASRPRNDAPPPAAFCGRWVHPDGVTSLTIAASGVIAYETVGQTVSGVRMAGWKEGACTIEGQILCFRKELRLELHGDGSILSVTDAGVEVQLHRAATVTFSREAREQMAAAGLDEAQVVAAVRQQAAASVHAHK